MPRTGPLVVFVCAIALAAPATGQAQESGMAQCAEIEGADARLACYDAAARRSAPSEPATEVAAEEPTEAASSREPLPLTQEVGEEQLPGGSGPERETESFRGRVVECKQDSARKRYFYFDNGQVWKQRANARLTTRDCDFMVTITKDGFGYKMQIEGEDKRIRVGRIR